MDVTDTYNEKKEETKEKDYARLIAAQNEAARRLKIKSINNTLTDEKKKKCKFAIFTGTCFAGLLASTHFSGIDINQAIQMEIESLNSFEGLKEYLTTFTPAMWATLTTTVLGLSKYIKHNKKYNDAKREYSDMLANEPIAYQDEVERQARSK